MSNKIFFLAAGWFILLLSCSYRLMVPEITQPAKIDYNYSGFIRTGEVRELRVPEAPGHAARLEYVWSADNGVIVSYENNVAMFQAPEAKGKLSVSCRLMERKKVLATHQFVLTVYRQGVILKADDLVYNASGIFPHQWNQYFALVDSLGIKGSAGIIGNSLENAPQAYYDRIKQFHKQGNIEFWNHGYSHALNMRNPNGEISHEFSNREYKDQLRHLNRTQELGRKKLGIVFRAFGAPGNAIDAVTTKLIDNSNDIAIWFYGDPASEKSILRRSPRCEIEYPTHKPGFQKFLANYSPEDEFLTLQFHPSSWDQQQFEEFRKIILHLYKQDAVFLTPTEFAKAFYPHLITPAMPL